MSKKKNPKFDVDGWLQCLKPMRCGYVLLLVLWILWSEFSGSAEKSRWTYIDTFEKRPVCEEQARQYVSGMKQDKDKKVLSSSATHLTYVSDKGLTYTLSFDCVPDTVDPRAK